MPFLLFIIYPLSEIAAFILVGEAIGLAATLALILISSALGLLMLRHAGIVTALKLRSGGARPVAILTEGGARMAAGLFLLVPGFLSDLAAMAVLFPPLRGLLLGRIMAGLRGRALPKDRGGIGRTRLRGSEPEVIDGDFRCIDP